jgi:hypothetical protein
MMSIIISKYAKSKISFKFTFKFKNVKMVSLKQFTPYIYTLYSVVKKFINVTKHAKAHQTIFFTSP